MEYKELFGALAKAQSEMATAELNCQNPYYKSKYADMAEIVRVSRPALTKNGLSVIQRILPNAQNQNVLHTVLCHSSGEWIDSQMIINPPKTDIQSIGSAITYLRRYAYAALVGVITSDEDDDGETAMVRTEPIKPKSVTINDEQYEILAQELEGHHDIELRFLKAYNIDSLQLLPKDQFNTALQKIREVKRNGIK
jgi:cAMP phosphodiesterase